MEVNKEIKSDSMKESRKTKSKILLYPLESQQILNINPFDNF